MDAAGEVDEIGEGTDTELHVGDAAMAIVVPDGSHGAYAEYVVVPAASAVRAPVGGVGTSRPSTLPMNAMTARLALDTLDLRARGRPLAVTGAAGALGGYVVQLAKADRLTVVADASEADEAAGARARRRRRRPARRRRGRAHPREPSRAGWTRLVDGSLQGDALLDAVRDGGKIATVRGHGGADERGITWHPVLVRDVATDHAAPGRPAPPGRGGRADPARRRRDPGGAGARGPPPPRGRRRPGSPGPDVLTSVRRSQPNVSTSSEAQRTRKSTAAPISNVVESQPLRHSRGARLLPSSHSSVIARNGMKNAPSAP